MQREEKDTLLNDEYARVPFSLIAILLVIMTGFTVAIQRDIQETTIETKISEFEVIFSELVNDSQSYQQVVPPHIKQQQFGPGRCKYCIFRHH